MHTEFTLHAITAAADYELFKSLLLEYAQRDLVDPQHSSIWKDIEQLPGRYGAPEGFVLLAYAKDELAGCAALVATAYPGIAEIKRVYVRAPFRRHGLARTLTLATIEQARQAGYQTAAIATWPDNPQALSLYRALDFVPIPAFRVYSQAQLVFLGRPLRPSHSEHSSPVE
jgi:ribosomal protein S18 acetylase RimI-like enzyme